VDKAGNVTQRTDARSVVTNYTYDALNRLTSVSYPSDSTLNATLTYDLSSGCGSAGIGQLCSVTDASGTTAYTYDLAGNVLTVTLPSGRTITTTRNANGQVSGVSAIVAGSSVNLASSITYLPFGPMNALTYGNSRTFSATYDQDYNPTNRTVSTIYNHSYDTDDTGNIIQIGSTDYGYDALNRLDEEDSGSATTYTYDATSNRLTKVNGGTTSTTVPSTSNKISAVGGTSYTYDAAGNVTAIGTQSYVWNAAGQMKEAKVSGSTVGTYTYDSQNRRVKKVAGGNTTHYVYGLNGLLYGEYDNSGNLIREYVYLNDAPLAQVDAGSPEVLTYLHPDHLGTPRFGTSTGGSQVWAWSSDTFGNGAPSGAATVNLRMPGQYYDAESGLFYNWNRYYNPATGRYISSDPIGIDGGLNIFLYAEASPVMYSDPRGLETPSISLGKNPLEATPPTKTEQCVRVCAGELFDDMNMAVQGAVAVGATPIPKKALGMPVIKGASSFTNPISLLGHSMADQPRLPINILGTNRLCGTLGRVNAYSAMAFGIYDSSAVAACTLICVSEGGL
jgi:RHS repeat-associated protein